MLPVRACRPQVQGSSGLGYCVVSFFGNAVREDTELVHGEIKRGTKIICYLKEDQSEFLEDVEVQIAR